MKKLNFDWVTEKRIDFEYKKYVLLAYLKKVSEEFTESKLYPSLSELITHYRNLVELRDSKESLDGSFNGKLLGVDLKQFKLIYEKLLEDDQMMIEIESIVNFSIPKFEEHLSEGKQIYEFIESHINIIPVGIIPMYNQEGYILIKYSPDSETRAYEYQITIFENPEEKYRALSTRYIGSFHQSIGNTIENIKRELISYRKNMPNPATFLIESDLKVPFDEALFPIAKRSFVRFVSLNHSGMA
jgi:hypothetical protein